MMTLPVWIWLALGLLPYQLKRVHNRNCETTLELRALFWELEVRRGVRVGTNWMIRVPLITRMRDAVWAAITRLRGE